MKWLLFIGYVVLVSKVRPAVTCTKPSFDSLNVPSDFDVNRFLGIWYEVKWLPTYRHNESEIWRNYYQIVEFENSSSQRLLVTGKARLLNNENCFSFGPAVITTNNSAKMIYEKSNINRTMILNWPYFVLKINYENYALIYGCTSNNYTHTQPCDNPILWLFSRTPSLANAYSIELDRYIQDILCINLTELEITPHDDRSCYSSSTINNFNFIFFLFILLYI